MNGSAPLSPLLLVLPSRPAAEAPTTVALERSEAPVDPGSFAPLQARFHPYLPTSLPFLPPPFII